MTLSSLWGRQNIGNRTQQNMHQPAMLAWFWTNCCAVAMAQQSISNPPQAACDTRRPRWTAAAAAGLARPALGCWWCPQ